MTAAKGLPCLGTATVPQAAPAAARWAFLFALRLIGFACARVCLDSVACACVCVWRQKWHPDKNQANAEEAKVKFQAISRAWSVLGDADARRRYDAGIDDDDDDDDDDIGFDGEGAGMFGFSELSQMMFMQASMAHMFGGSPRAESFMFEWDGTARYFSVGPDPHEDPFAMFADVGIDEDEDGLLYTPDYGYSDPDDDDDDLDEYFDEDMHNADHQMEYFKEYDVDVEVAADMALGGFDDALLNEVVDEVCRTSKVGKRKKWNCGWCTASQRTKVRRWGVSPSLSRSLSFYHPVILPFCHSVSVSVFVFVCVRRGGAGWGRAGHLSYSAWLDTRCCIRVYARAR